MRRDKKKSQSNAFSEPIFDIKDDGGRAVFVFPDETIIRSKAADRLGVPKQTFDRIMREKSTAAGQKEAIISYLWKKHHGYRLNLTVVVDPITGQRSIRNPLKGKKLNQNTEKKRVIQPNRWEGLSNKKRDGELDKIPTPTELEKSL